MAKSRMIIPVVVIIILVIIIVVQTQSTPTGMVVKSTEIILPSNAQKLSECIPNMGAHYANPSDLPFGPIYLVDKGKVIGIEYMIHEDELDENIISVGAEETGKVFVMPAFDVVYDHIELNYLPGGHEGDTEPHYDLHMYMISPTEQRQLCQ